MKLSWILSETHCAYTASWHISMFAFPSPLFYNRNSGIHTHFASFFTAFFTCNIMKIISHQSIKSFHALFHGCPVFLSLFIALPWLMRQSRSNWPLYHFQPFVVANNTALDNLPLCHFRHMLGWVSDTFLRGWISESKSVCFVILKDTSSLTS